MLGRPALIPGASRRRAHLRDLTPAPMIGIAASTGVALRTLSGAKPGAAYHCIGCPEHLNPLQQFVLTCAMFLAALLAHPIHFSIDVLLLTHDEELYRLLEHLNPAAAVRAHLRDVLGLRHDATPARGDGWPVVA